jgi:hypothetical protein
LLEPIGRKALSQDSIEHNSHSCSQNVGLTGKGDTIRNLERKRGFRERSLIHVSGCRFD